MGVVFSYVLLAQENFFAWTFSNPLATYFLSVFNYFSFSSIYVLLNIAIPEIVFKNLEKIY